MSKLFKRIKHSNIVKNIKYFIPLLFKLNPFSVIATVISAVIESFRSLMWIYFPKEIIELLTEKTNPNQKEDLIKIVILFLSIQLLINMIVKIISNVQTHYSSVADFKIDQMFNNKVAELDYYCLEDPEFIDKLDLAKKGLSQYSNGIYSVLYALENVIYSIITRLSR